MSVLAKLLLRFVGPRALSRFAGRCEKPMLEQDALLRKILRDNADTAFGRRHGFASIRSLRAFQQRVPVNEYEDLEPYVEAARRGERDQLTRERPVFYAKTSGTTGPAKYIPVTETSRRAKAQVMRVWLCGLFRDHPAILDGKVLQVTSPEVEEYAPDGTPCGAEGGHAYRNMPGLVRRLYPVPYEVCEISDYEARYHAMLRIAVMHPIAIIGTPNPSTIVLLARQLGERAEALIRDVRDGTLDPRLDLPAGTRKMIESTLEADPARAKSLERAASARGGRLVPGDVWPELGVLACWKGGTLGAYLEQLESYFPDGIRVRDLGWLASECRGSVPLSDEGDSGALAVSTNIYEFFPADAAETPAPEDLLTLDRIKEGERHCVYVTTLGGLYRYAMHDILEVTGFHGRTPCVRFVQKEKGILNFTGEKLTEAQVLAAAEDVLDSRRTGRAFVAAVGRPASEAEDPSYLFLVEYPTLPDEAEATRTARELERALERYNTEYAAKRQSGRLGPAVLRVLKRGELDAYERRALRQGARDGQFKFLRLTDDPRFAEQFQDVVGDYRAV
jgi:hypothetical protein